MTRALVADVVRSSCVDGPGNRYVVFLQGCTFNCVGCHNPHTIPRTASGSSRWMTVDELVADIAADAPFLSGVTISGGEATLQWEAVHELFERLALDPATSRLTRLVDSNGDADPIVWSTLSTSMHGAMVDLKALDDAVHRRLTGRSNARVLASIVQLVRRHRLAEVRLLIVPGVNDSPSQLAATARWLGGLDVVPHVVVQGFRREGTRAAARAFEEATEADLDRVSAFLADQGLRSISTKRAAAASTPVSSPVATRSSSRPRVTASPSRTIARSA